MNMPNRPNLEETKIQALTSNTTQSVRQKLEDLDTSRKHKITRWVWELLQNARDTSANVDSSIVASIEYRNGVLSFQHNGAAFNAEQVAHLIYHGSTKDENEERIGQYGTGFITTHLLSKKVEVSGQLDDGCSFSFFLKRDGSTNQELQEQMDDAWQSFKSSLSDASDLQQPITRFTYTSAGDEDFVVQEGIAALRRCAPLVLAFNREFAHINIQMDNDSITYNLPDNNREEISHDHAGDLLKITVIESNGIEEKQHTFIVATSEKTSVAIPLDVTCVPHRCVPTDEIPSLFLGFPLVNTENFGFPAIINSFKFTPTEERDGVPLARGENEVNLTNQEIICDACALLVKLLSLSAQSGWGDVWVLAKIPDTSQADPRESIWLKNTLREHFVDKIRHTPVITVSKNSVVAPVVATLPVASDDKNVGILWDLLNACTEKNDTLPSRSEAIGWNLVVASWQNIDPDYAVDEALDGVGLAQFIDEHARQGGKERTKQIIQNFLGEICVVEWLDQLHNLLIAENLSVANKYHIVLSQSGCLCTLDELYRDQGIAKELKEIAEILGWPIRQKLRDSRLTSLANKNGLGDRDNKDIIRDVLEKLKVLANQEPCEKFAKASVKTFAWVASQQDWQLMEDGFPVSSASDKDGAYKIIRLRLEEEDDKPLTPILSWPENLQQYADIFSSHCILANAYFSSVSKSVWAAFICRGLLRENALFTKNLSFNAFLPDGLLGGDHKTKNPVPVTDIAFLTKEKIGIMSRISRNKSRALLFWNFLTEWLIAEDANGLVKITAACECGEDHDYFPAKWLVPVARNKWIFDGQSPTAESLAGLLRGGGQEYISQSTDDLLRAIGINHIDLLLELAAKDDPDVRKNIEAQTRAFVQAVQNDPSILGQLEKWREKEVLRQKSQELGLLVEKSVRQILESADFVVERTGIGSDFKIFTETEDESGDDSAEAGLKVTRKNEDKSWLIEVKATRIHKVHMTQIQAKKAANNTSAFLLCVVPVETSEPEIDVIQRNMRFVVGIGDRVAKLCDDLDDFELHRGKITELASTGAQLEITSGAKIRIDKTVWESDGIPLEYLPKYLEK